MRKKNPIDALFPKVRQNILAATYTQPEKWWFMSELASFIKTTPSSLQRELNTLIESGILRSRRDGNRLYFQAETDSPIFAPLRDLIFQTKGIISALEESLTFLSGKIDFAFVYGSVARKEENTQSDVDLMIIGAIGLAEVSPILRDLERKFNREINATCYSLKEFQKKVISVNHFLREVLGKEKIFLIGEQNELAKLTDERINSHTYNQPAGN